MKGQPSILFFCLLLALSVSSPAVRAYNQEARRLEDLASEECKKSGTRLSALQHVNKALTLEPKSGRLWHLKGAILQSLEEFEEALPCVNKALEYSPDDDYFWRTKAILLSGLHKNAEAVAAADQAMRINPGEMSCQIKAQVLAQSGRYSEAEKLLDRAVTFAPNYDVLRARRASVAALLHHWDKAIEDLTFVIDNNKNPTQLHSYANNFCHRAEAYMQTKQYDKAIADYKTGLKRSPDDRKLHAGLLRAFKATGNTKGAEAENKKLNDLDGDIRPL